MPTPLTNDRWGYESNCFVCEQRNEAGLRIPFLLDDDHETVTGSFTLGAAHSGAPTLVHGGVALAILNEAQAWACIAVAGKWALTRTTSSTFEGPVVVDAPHRVEARVTLDADGALETEAMIMDGRGRVMVRSTASFTVIGDVDPAQRALGLDPEHRHLLGE